jgi:multiple sugar transport system substrate-binding protein
MKPTRTRRRLVRSAAVALACTGLLAACSSSGSTAKSAGPVTVTYWGWANGQNLVAQQFNATHKDVQIKYTKIADQATEQQELTNAVKAGNAPCLFQNTAENVTTMVSQGVVTDITAYAGASAAQFNKGAWAGAQVQGKVYGIPTSSAPNFTIYRADVFA